MKRKVGYPREYRGWIVQRDGGFDVPWRAWRSGHLTLRADTLAGLQGLIAHAEGA